MEKIEVFWWMTKLGLTPAQMLILARLYASIKVNGIYDGSIRELSRWNGSTYMTAINSMKTLIERDIIVKDGRTYYLSERIKARIND